MENRTPYKTAAELGIEQWEHDGLVALVGPLSRGELEFDIRDWDCGTAHCIGGWLWANAEKDWEDSSHHSIGGGRLYKLYLPGMFADSATSTQASCAIVNFLVTGDPQWDAVMAEV